MSVTQSKITRYGRGTPFNDKSKNISRFIGVPATKKNGFRKKKEGTPKIAITNIFKNKT